MGGEGGEEDGATVIKKEKPLSCGWGARQRL
nr:MAG TPA: hypothetical protein [Caudoviricetes sp.]